jgi:hypothetical protein
VKHGLVLCAPGDTHVVTRYVCHNYRSAVTRGRAWKRKYPDHVVRVISLCPGDTAPPEVIELVLLSYGRRKRANKH